MFDAHAHIGTKTDNALICTSSPDEAINASGFRYISAGLLPESGSDGIELYRECIKRGYSSGEIGLDRRFDGKEHQIGLFRESLITAIEYDRLITIHSVGYTDILLREIRNARPKRFIIHGFTGSYETAKEITALGGLISLGPRSLRSKDIKRLITLPFTAESDMKTGEEQQAVLQYVIRGLSIIAGTDIEEKADCCIKEILDD